MFRSILSIFSVFALSTLGACASTSSEPSVTEMTIRLTPVDGEEPLFEATRGGRERGEWAATNGCAEATLLRSSDGSGNTYADLYFCQVDVPVSSSCWERGELNVQIEEGSITLRMDSGDLSDAPSEEITASVEDRIEYTELGYVSYVVQPEGDCLDQPGDYLLEISWELPRTVPAEDSPGNKPGNSWEL